MAESKKPIQAIVLSNGLLLELYDLSRKIAGDRWQVGMLARIDIPLADALMALIDHHPEDLPAFREANGGTVRFEQKRERNFIDGNNKDRVFQDMLNLYLRQAQEYLSHPDFARKYVRRQYQDYLKRKLWITIDE